MSRRTIAPVLIAIVLLAHEVAVAEPIQARVTYISGSTVYIDAGTEQGLAPGHRVELMRGEEKVALLEVRDLSSRRAACTIVEQWLAPTIDDRASFEPGSTGRPTGTEAAAVAAGGDNDGGADRADDAGSSTRSSGRAIRRSGIRGRVGLRYLTVRNRDDDSNDLSQPALDLRVDALNIGGGAWGGAIDARARRSYRGDQDGDDRTRVYRLFVARNGVDDPWNVTVGRQFSPALAGVSIFDGAAVDYSKPRWSTGLLAGSQPDPADQTWSDTIQEYGAYFQYRGAPGPRHWELTTGVIGSYEESEINREFLYLQGRYNGPRLSLYATQEIDFNRGWKAEEGESSLSSTASFISARYRVSDAVDLRGGYDNRRNVRLYRDYVTPVTEFDDAYRRGLWGGATVRLGRSFRVGADVRTADGGSAGTADTYTLFFGASRLSSARIDLRLRATGYENELTDGVLLALDAGMPLGHRVRLSLHGGVRDEQSRVLAAADRTLRWVGLDLDLDLGEHWYWLLDVERTQGDYENVDQVYTALSYRF